ncbi:acyltransferase family protein [Nocardia harenae]|uniref:acyltransferase family protein n=1 Tax=Nocardia harenae TaxID=358707 RepID=UPI00082D6748|nr:acyltransferase family protein [Nocardia harenae]
MHDDRPPAQRYRHDLDGLRGVAIALVVVFHVWFGRVSGGVDVFLVLSGFFFTAMLLRRGAGGGVSVPAVVVRTLRRLLPALLVVLTSVAAWAVATLPYTQWTELSRQVLASALYYQNWQLASAAADYLAADPSVSPLQHLWSMAVQGQFYLAVLLLIAFVALVCRRVLRRPRLLRPAVGVLVAAGAAASFWYAATRPAVEQDWTYYDSAARAWELLAGALLAVLLASVSLPAGRVARFVRGALALGGLAAVLACGVLFDGAQRFPGPAALFPVLATVALIVAGAGERPPAVSRLLASWPFVELGAIAYALYLWHWPLLIGALIYTRSGGAGLGSGLVVVGLALLLAVLTRHGIEEPLRQRSGRQAGRAPVLVRRGIGAAVALAGITALGAAWFWQAVLFDNERPLSALDPVVYPGADALVAGVSAPPAAVRPSMLEAPRDVPASTTDGCISDWHTTAVVTCDYGDPDGERAIAVVGNSHAEHWLTALDAIGRAHGVRIAVYLKMGCSLNLREDSLYRGEPISDCRDWSRAVLDQLAVDRPDWVFTTATAPVWPVGGDEVPQGFVEVWGALAERDLRVLAVRDTPWLRTAYGRYRAVDCLAAGGTAESCGMLRADALAPVNPALEPAAAFPNVHLLDLSDAVCGPRVCRVVEGNVLVYHDEHHLTASYVRTLTPELERQIGAGTGWW